MKGDHLSHNLSGALLPEGDENRFSGGPFLSRGLMMERIPVHFFMHLSVTWAVQKKKLTQEP